MYNDYSGFTPSHADAEEQLLKVMNPNSRGRPIRAGSILKTKFAEFRSTYSTAIAKFRRSGQHLGDKSAAKDEFWQQYANGNIVLLYMYCAWDGLQLEFVNRQLPQGMAREEGIVLNLSTPTSSNDGQTLHVEETNIQVSRASLAKRNSKRRTSADTVAVAVKEMSTPPDIKKRRHQNECLDTESFQQIANAMEQKAKIQADRVRLKGLLDVVSCSNLSQEIKIKAEERLLEFLDTFSSGNQMPSNGSSRDISTTQAGQPVSPGNMFNIGQVTIRDCSSASFASLK